MSERIEREQVRHQWVRLALAIGLIAGLGSCTAVRPDRPVPPPVKAEPPARAIPPEPAMAEPPQASPPPPPVEPEPLAGWRADLRLFAEQVPLLHKDAFHALPRDPFQAAVGALDQKLAGMQRHEILVELARILARLEDGHATLNWATAGFHSYPVKYYLFSDGLYLIAADPAYAAVVGGRVVTLGNLSDEEAFYRVAEVISHDNKMQRQWLTPYGLATVEVLGALRVATDMDRVPLTVEKNGRLLTVELRPAQSMSPVQFEVSLAPPPGWADARKDAKNPTPLWLKDSAAMFFSEALPKERTLYVQFNRVFDKPNQTLAAFFDTVLKDAETGPYDRLVIDMRRNGFGNHSLLWPLWNRIQRSKKLNKPGALFVLTGRNTFSAAMRYVNHLSLHTGAVFAGEPTGGRPNHFGNGIPLNLPHLRAGIVLPTLWSEDIPGDERPWHAPDLGVELSFADYRDNLDPVLRAVLRYKDKRPTVERIPSSRK